ncbi:MAG: lysine--tRNA ligase [Candidatus Omnitrophica bacterium]|nr:lysine--tRNA ligase [Candidatus Omnitrophota bacterium]
MHPESELLKEREKKIGHLAKEKGINLYGGRFMPCEPVKNVRDNFEAGKHVRVAGRLMTKRLHGKSIFADLKDGSGRIQVYAKQDIVGDGEFDLFEKLDMGDIVGIEGELFQSRTGEQTIKIEKFQLLSKIVQILPEKWHGLKDIELCYRKRYLDLIMNDETRETFRLRSKIIRAIRSFLNERGFMEVETPMMQPIPGGAKAEPFKTHHRALHRDLYLRVAPELYLKRLLVGGFDKVYELNRNFRNEGISVRHNPEFTMLELYQSFADLRDMMDITEEMVCSLARECFGKEEIKRGDDTISLGRPWKRLGFYEALKEKTDVEWRKADVRKEAERLGIKLEANYTEPDILNEVFDEKVQTALKEPTFITDYPVSMSPLCKAKPNDKELADRFELFIGHMELANAFTELNDPAEQRKRFTEQRQKLGEAKEIDEDFLHALEYAMPPAGGLGIGIDRLVMLLVNKHSIRDVILFPQLRAEHEE